MKTAEKYATSLLGTAHSEHCTLSSRGMGRNLERIVLVEMRAILKRSKQGGPQIRRRGDRGKTWTVKSLTNLNDSPVSSTLMSKMVPSEVP